MKYLLPAFFATLLLLNTPVQAGENWSVPFETQPVFIENKGQFNYLNNLPQSEVLFGTDKYSSMILFTKTGLTYRLEERIQPDKAERQRREQEMTEQMKNGKQISHKEMEQAEHKPTIRTDYVQMQWENANPNVVVRAEEKVSQYFNYGTISYVKAYSKIVYENIYAGIDVEYVFHPEGGIEYSFILHPGADASQIKMKYSDVANITNDEKGNLHFPTLFGDIIEHAPQTFYAKNKKSEISSGATLSGTTISFQLGNYDRTQEVVIDPWVQTPTFASQWDCVWEVEKDGAGNGYLIGGVTPMQLLKYNAAGTLQWTYSTPYDTTSWLGTFATDNAGNSYVTQGSLAAIQKISTAGGLVWSNGNPGGIFSSTEFWSISFNCDQTKLVIGGTGNFLPPLPYIYQVDMNSGNVTSSVQITGGALFPTQEVRCITACGNGKYYFLTHDSIGYINQNFGVCANASDAVFYVDNDYGLGYKCENFRYNNTGVEAMKTYGGFVYVNRGNRLDKRNFNTGAIIQSVTIPGGNFATTQVQNSGLDIDVCGNIYVGSKGQVLKFDQNLAQLASYPIPAINSQTVNVYDVEVSTSGNIIVGGSTGTSGSGVRYSAIHSIAASACSIVAITCCDASICQAGPFCTVDAPVTLVASTPGGVWSGPGITNATTGVFNPTIAGQGNHYITYTLGCGSDSILIKVNICSTIVACLEQNGSITASGGAAPYTWYEMDTVQDCTSCILGCFLPPGCAVTNYTWNQFATGATATAPEFPVRVTDNNSNELVILNTSSLPACSACALNASASSTSATCGNNGGSATATASGATPTGYTWSNGATTAIAPNLVPGTYTVTITSTGCNATASTTVNSTGSVTASANATNAGCAPTGSASVTPTGGTGSFTYLWSNSGTAATISNLPAGTYTVTVTSGTCTTTSSAVVNSTGSVSASASSTSAGCISNGTATASPTGGTGSFTYLWSNGGTSAIISNLSGGTYTVTVTSGTCTTTASAVVSSTGGVTTSTSSTNAGCSVSDGSATVNPSGGNGSFTYLWSNGGTGSTISNLAGGTYTVTVTSGSCTATASAIVSSANAVTASASAVNAGCAGNGSATVSPSGGTGTFTYLWSNGGTSATISNIPAGTYTVTVTSSTCTATASAIVSSTGSVTASASATNAGCTSTGTASVAPTGGTGSFTYLWSNGGTSATITSIPAGTYTVTVTSGSCTVTASAIVNSTGSVTASTSSTNAGCTSTGSATVAPGGGTGTFTYLWSNGGTTATISTLSGGTYTVTVTSGNCTATAVASVISTGGVTLSTSATPTTCGNFNGSASVSTTTGAAPFTYLWSNGGTGTAITNLPAGTYSVTVGDNNGCSATSAMIVNASVPDTADITSNKTIMCSGDSATICVIGTYVTYLWNTGQTTQCINTKLAGNYYVTVTDNSSCTASSNRVSLGVHPLPPVSISVNGDTLTAYNAVTYQWYYNNNPIPNATSSVYIAPASGDYSLAVTDSNGCRATSTKVSIIKTGIFNYGKEEVVKIYPNPFENGYLNVEVGSALLGSWLEVFDDIGRLVYKLEIGNRKSEINLNVASGTYILRISSNQLSVTHKLIKL